MAANRSPTQQLISRREEKQSSSKELCRAAGDGDLAKVKALLEKGGVLIDDVDAHGSSPAHYAARHGRLDMVTYLHKAGARFDRTNVRDSGGVRECHAHNSRTHAITALTGTCVCAVVVAGRD